MSMPSSGGIQPNQGKGNNIITGGQTKTFSTVPIISTFLAPAYKTTQITVTGGGTFIPNSGNAAPQLYISKK